MAGELRAVIAAADLAGGLIVDRYWEACRAAGAAINPRGVGAPPWLIELLDEQYEIALAALSDATLSDDETTSDG